jgi:hypothetical protein
MRSALRIVRGLQLFHLQALLESAIKSDSRLCKTGVTYIGPMRTERSPYSFRYKSYEPNFFIRIQ